MNFLSETLEELSYAFTGSTSLTTRTQLALSFTLVDVLSTYWLTYIGEQYVPQRASFKRWIDGYCLTTSNNVYDSSKLLKEVTSSDLYRLRNSIVHFYGLPRENDIMIAPKAWTTDKTETFIKDMRDKTGIQQFCIESVIFFDMVRAGGALLLNEMKDNMRHDPNSHIEGIKRLHAETSSRGAVKIDLD